jgi:hypothetical protein
MSDGWIDLCPDAVLVVDGEGRIEDCNALAVSLFGHAREALQGCPVEVLVPERFRAAHPGHVRRFFAEGRSRPLNSGLALCACRADGREFPAQISLMAVNADGRLRVFAFVRDATEASRREALLRESEARFRRLAENARDLIYRYRVFPDPGYDYVSPAATAMTGYTPEEHYADPAIWRKYVHPVDIPRIEACLAAGDLGSAPFRVRFVHRSGHLLWVESRSVSVRDEAGRTIAFEGISRDITESNLLEDRLRQGQKMEAIGRLAGGVAHDFNNLLTVILGYGEILREKMGASAPELEEILKAGDSATVLTRQLLAFGRKQMRNPAAIDLRAVVERMEGMLRRIVGEDVRMASMLAPDAGTVWADVHQVEQILLNLAANARDAMPHGGSLEIRVGNRSIDAAFAASRAGLRPGDYVVLTVADTGSGMDEETLSHLFEPFFTTKEMGRGTGLGLSTIYGIVKQSDGYVDVRSEPGKGAEFSIYLPRLDAPPAAPGPLPPPVAVRGGGETVLVVDDSTSILRLVAAVLRARGYRVLEAGDGAQALEMSARHEGTLHLLVTDVVMPEVGGMELALQVRRLRPETRVLFMTGYAPQPGLAEEVRDAGALLLEKPFSPEQLLAKVGEALVPRA